MRITAPGFYEMPATAYHADPCPAPSLSHSISKILLNRSPRHAKHAHPRLTVRPAEEATAAMDAGSALHKLILGKGDDITIIPFDDYKKAAAQEARNAARAAHQIPILQDEIVQIRDCAAAAEEQIRAHPDLRGFYAPGAQSEVVMAWQEGAIWCRSMIDRLNRKTGQAYDLKSTMLSAAPWSWERRLQTEYATQDSFYRRGLAALGIENPPPMLFIPVEQKAPFCISSLAADSTLQFWAKEEVQRAIDTWATCLAEDIWPGYPPVTYHASATGWMLDKQEERAAGAKFTPKPTTRAKGFATSEFSDFQEFL